ncbi:YadA-like family protein [Acidithiobacillus ferriphilus]|nr:YadA-like family protein [Acidithiobacillus ferriphilus]
MKKQIIAVAVLSALALSPAAFAGSVQGSNSTPTTAWDSQGDMASGPGSYAAGSTQTPGTLVQCADGICIYTAAAPNSTNKTAPGYNPSFASGTGAFAGPGKGETVIGGDTALGAYAAALGRGSTALGNYAWALGNGSTALGSDSVASGLASTATGSGSRASGTVSTADGVNSTAGGNYSTATGAFSSAGGFASTADGAYASASGSYSTSTGAGSAATGYASTALGNGATAKGTSSVALGQGSVSNRANSVSVGNASTGMTRQITNVSAGTQGTDAVNLNQLNGTAANLHQQITSTAQQLQQQFSTGIAGVHSYATREADSVGALSAATADAAFSAAGLHTPNRVALGVGEMGGQVAESVAYQHAFGRNWTANATIADGTAGMQIGVGAGYGW